MFFSHLCTIAEKKQGISQHDYLFARVLRELDKARQEHSVNRVFAQLTLNDQTFKLQLVSKSKASPALKDGVYLTVGSIAPFSPQSSVRLDSGVPLNWTSFVALVGEMTGVSEDYIWEHGIGHDERTGAQCVTRQRDPTAATPPLTLRHQYKRRLSPPGPLLGGLHPLCTALLTSITPGAASAVEPVLIDTVFARQAKFTAVYARDATPQVRQWATQILTAIETDDSTLDSPASSKLIAEALIPEALPFLHHTVVGDPLASTAGPISIQRTHHTVMLTSLDKRTAIGYCAFTLRWYALHKMKLPSDVSLEVEIHEVYLAPAYRRKGLSALLMYAVVQQAVTSAKLLDFNCQWRNTKRVTYQVLYCAEVVSEGGARFLQTCAQRHAELEQDQAYSEQQLVSG
ncbi:MAG: GNAT family N-acetyltransferase, partial [Agitococcus sp.]|nr:GNAT family N-acetyltransferase [Agitococcus sp.]